MSRTPDNEKYILCFDESGTPKLTPKTLKRDDCMDWFAYGGVIVKGEDVQIVGKAHETFCLKHDIDYPLHSTDIRSKRENFRWLLDRNKQLHFQDSITKLITSLPLMVTAAVVHRPGYVKRYEPTHSFDTWEMDKTALCILIERAAKFALHKGRKLEIFFESGGPRENKSIIEYTRELKRSGLPFNEINMGSYSPMASSEFRNVLLGDPIAKSKKFSLAQIADLVLYPVCKSRYITDYPPVKYMQKAGMLIDQHLPEKLANIAGIKYSCFDDL